MEKDLTIVELLEWLRQALGDGFSVASHWDGDLCAIGLTSPNDPSQLVYILSFGRPSGHYAVELEAAAPEGCDLPRQTVGKFNLVNREELLSIIKAHLGISK